jgi:hypothetical protein
MCVDCVLASPRIAQADPGRRTPPQGGSITWRMEGFSTRHIARSREASSHGKRESASCALRQTSYTNHRRRELSFKVRDFVYPKVSPMRGLHCFKVWGKLARRFIGPFKITEKKGEVAYQLELPPQLSDVHNVFHISQWNKWLCVPE